MPLRLELIGGQVTIQPRDMLMNQTKPAGLHPEAQRLLWSLVYNQPESFENISKPRRQLEQRGLIQLVESIPGAFGGDRWEATPAGVAELQAYAPFLRCTGRLCPPGG